jgi:hypothetical protein
MTTQPAYARFFRLVELMTDCAQCDDMYGLDKHIAAAEKLATDLFANGTCLDVQVSSPELLAFVVGTHTVLVAKDPVAGLSLRIVGRGKQLWPNARECFENFFRNTLARQV